MNNKTSRRNVLKMVGASAAAATGIAGLLASKNIKSQPQKNGGAPTAVVVGAGIAGLSAAYDLQQAGFSVTVMDKASYIGGRMRNDWVGPIYTTPHAIGVQQDTKEIFSLAKEVGIEKDFLGEEESDAYIIDNGVGNYRVSLKFDLKEVLKIPGFSEATKEKLLLLENELNKIRSTIDSAYITTGAEYDIETVEEYFNRVLGKEASAQFMDYWLDTYLDPWGLPRDSSCVAVLGSMAHGRPFSTPKAGIGVLTTKLGELVPVQNRTTVRYITPPDETGRHTIHFLTPDLERKSVTPDVVVCATEGKYVPEIVQGLSEEERIFFKSIDFSKIVRVAYILDPSVNPIEPRGGAYIPRHPDPYKSQVWFWHTAAAGTEHPANPPRIYVDLHRSPENIGRWQRSGKSQPDYCLPLLKKLYPELDESKIVDTVTLGVDELAYLPKGFIKKAAKLLANQEKKKRGLYYAGEYLAGSHVAAACASGRTTARTIINHWV